MRRPAASRQALILPVRFRRVASGLMMDSVRSVAMAGLLLVGREVVGREVVGKAVVGKRVGGKRVGGGPVAIRMWWTMRAGA